MLSAALLLLSNSLFLTLHLSGNPGSFPRPLSRQEERECLEQWAQGDLSARNRLVEHNLRLVAHIIKKYYTQASNQEDLISIGTIGLMKAISTFDPGKTTRLSTYAARCIDNELLMMFRTRKKHSREVSLYEPIGTDKEGNEISLLDVMEGPAVDVVEEYSTRESIRHVLGSMKTVLTEKEYEVICCRFGLFGKREQTQREIARHLHISRSYVSRIEKNALHKLRTLFPES